MSVKVKTIKERLEGTYRLVRIRRLKLWFFIVQIALALVLGIMAAFLLGARFNPLYFSLDVFAFLFLLLMLIICAEAIYFKGIELKYTRSKSRKYMIARNSMRRAATILGVAVLGVVFLMLPFSVEMISDIHPQGEGGLTLNPGESGNFTFDTQDAFGLTRANDFSFTIASNTPVNLHFYNDEGILLWEGNDVANTYVSDNVGLHSSEMMDIRCFVNHTGADDVTYSWSIESEVSPFISYYLPALFMAFIIIQMVSISVLYPVREANASASIYSKKYVAKEEASEYLIEERKPITEEEAEEEALLESTIDITVPAPAPPPPPPDVVKAEPVRVEMPKKVGEVEEDLIEEPDIPCPNCGEMNSPHAAMCFVCGSEMKEREVVPAAVDLKDIFRKGTELSRAGNHEEAIKCFDEVLMREKSNEEALFGKGVALHREGKWGMAIQYINTALQVNPRNVDALLRKAEILSERDKHDKAMEIYNQILVISPGNEIAKARIEEATVELAIEDVEDVIEQFMCIPGVGLARATTLYEMGYITMGHLKAASERELAQVKGISERLAKKIKKQLESI